MKSIYLGLLILGGSLLNISAENIIARTSTPALRYWEALMLGQRMPQGRTMTN